MLSLALASELKEAGLVWRPALHDFFAIPSSDLEERVFVVADMTIDVQKLFGRDMITFNGAVEWSLDYIMIADVVWMPTEAQLRELLQDRLLAESQPAVALVGYLDGYQCQIQTADGPRTFEALTAADAYGAALLFLLDGSAPERPDLSA
ncbi:MAG: hypothetical protein R3300_07665 [Candidatus Promineifilaceae bacterium]|nr:hypothetical protein [Candidatus Promineifilaceae bacterium]